ncbi:hypothetical protein BaRGS_00011929 [Batillaria attramentaria]|uniref:Uncharacterized protein n=1 Tax=Batillaria attramentaria TaxID=370345 RepID=A0ABD0LBR8_9CAEN
MFCFFETGKKYYMIRLVTLLANEYTACNIHTAIRSSSFIFVSYLSSYLETLPNRESKSLSKLPHGTAGTALSIHESLRAGRSITYKLQGRADFQASFVCKIVK